jgi:hypothetical protein
VVVDEVVDEVIDEVVAGVVAGFVSAVDATVKPPVGATNVVEIGVGADFGFFFSEASFKSVSICESISSSSSSKSLLISNFYFELILNFCAKYLLF